MTITEKTRKILWARSGNRCTLCKCELIYPRSFDDEDSIIGEECHIMAKQKSGPRGRDDLPLEKRDDYENLILLCSIHHKVIDDQPQKFTSDYLREMRKEHETWVQKSLGYGLSKSSSIFPAFRIDSGKQLLDLIVGCDAGVIENDQVKTQGETDLIGSITQDIHDYLDMWSDLSQRDRIQAQLDLHEQIVHLFDCGFLVYSCTRRQKLKNELDENGIIFDICYIFIIRVSNNLTKKKDNKIEEIFAFDGQLESIYSNFIFFVSNTHGIRFI